ncbi:hypothetical protein FSP39_001697 [Pinctada imbricata]|uniref:Uncharacterized protein n=1 Tax=Pinctada imbricata TaxID=66713 RepID=A0AA89BZN4_PINIB|nr:hypothetical protein FSP39_001697 [Pinctada imbricata]
MPLQSIQKSPDIPDKPEYGKNSGRIPHLKIALVGDPEVGKTCVMLRYLKNQFSPMYLPTKKAVIETAVKKLNVPGHAVVSLTVWDIPGREDIDLHKTYFRNLDAAIVVVDMTNPASIEMAPVWRQIVLNNTYLTHPVEDKSSGGIHTTTMEEVPVDRETFPILLMGNKFDVIEQRVQAERLKKYTQEMYSKGKHTDSSAGSDTEGIERRVWSIGEPLTEEEKPESVKMLEQQSRDHNFQGCMMVSARDGDGTVKEAVQQLIRHLLENKYALKRHRPKTKKGKKKEKERKEFDKLENIGVVEFDNIFMSASISIQKVGLMHEYHNKSIKKLKEACQLAQILEGGDHSLEDCIAAIKGNVGEGAKLKIKKDEEFCKLELDKKDEDFKLEKKMKIILNIFHTEYAKVCNAILTECPGLDSTLQQKDASLAELCQESWELVAVGDDEQPRSKEDIERISHVVEDNRARMQHAWLEARAAVNKVEDEKKKIKAAFLW